MEIALIILTILLLLITAGGFAALFFAYRHPKQDPRKDEQVFKLQGQVENLSQALHERIHETNQNIQKQYSESMKIIRDVTERLGRLDETNKQIIDYTSQLQKLENILRNPKHRGIMGEYLLESLLSNIFAPGQYKMQYKFPDGNLVDAVIFVKDKIIPIDAKFSLEKYDRLFHEQDPEKVKSLEKELRNDFKARINETRKYVMPQHNTTDFALMFIPAEGVFYHFLSMKVGAMDAGSSDLLEYAFSQKVIITSPTTFFAYLQTIMHALRALRIEESVKDVITRVGKLGSHLEKFDEFMLRLGNNLSKTVGSYNNAYKELGKVDKDIVRITDREKSIEANIVDKPVMDR